jgi:hypothetical protein
MPRNSWEFCAPHFYDFARGDGGDSSNADEWFESDETKGLCTPVGLVGKAQTNKAGRMGGGSGV